VLPIVRYRNSVVGPSSLIGAPSLKGSLAEKTIELFVQEHGSIPRDSLAILEYAGCDAQLISTPIHTLINEKIFQIRFNALHEDLSNTSFEVQQSALGQIGERISDQGLRFVLLKHALDTSFPEIQRKALQHIKPLISDTYHRRDLLEIGVAHQVPAVQLQAFRLIAPLLSGEFDRLVMLDHIYATSSDEVKRLAKQQIPYWISDNPSRNATSLLYADV
jgi:hypothetical protein